MNVGVVGAGLTGLATGFQLAQAGHQVTLYESSERAGGMVHTKHRDGFLLEQGAGSAQGASREVYQLFIDAGLAGDVVPVSEAAAARFLLHEGKLTAFPSGLKDLFRIPGVGRRGALRMLQEPLRRGRIPAEETVYDFLRRRVGPHAANALADPMMAGTFAGDPRRIEVNSAFPQWVDWERSHGSLMRGASRHRTTPPAGLPNGSFSLRGGLGALTDRLAYRLGDRLRCSEPVHALTHARSSVTVHTSTGAHEHGHVLITTPQSNARTLLADAPTGWFDDLPTAPLAAIHLAYNGPDVPGGLPGFGWLAHSAQRQDALGCLWVSGTFPSHAPPGKHLLRIMVGGTRAPELANRSDAELTTLAQQLLQDVQGIDATPLFTEVNRAAIPQYPLGFARRLRLIRQLHPRIRFAGWSWGHLGVAASIQAAAELSVELRNR